MKYFILLSLVYTCYICCATTTLATTTTTASNQQVVDYLYNYGYITSLNVTRNELRRSLRQLQRENNLTVNGRITPEVVNFVTYENDKNMVINYLKTYNYILGDVTPLKVKDAVTVLQQNSGTLNVTGLIDTPTITFVRTRPQGYSEGLFAN